MTRWRTSPDDATVPQSGWEQLPGGAWITRHPLLDGRAGLIARLTYRDARAVAAAAGARLPTRAEVVESIAVARRTGRVLRPVTLSHGPEMVTRAHAEEHDRRVAAQLVGWDGRSIVAGVGKHWVAGAAPGRSRICGWPTPDGGLIQQGIKDVHGDDHYDYATTTLLVRDSMVADDPTPVPDTEPAPPPEPHGHVVPARPLGERVVDVARSYLGVREIPGPAHNPVIQRFLAGCRRGGSPTAGMGDDRSGAVTLGPRAPDETEWCAAAATTCLAEALLPGDEPPCGRRAACWEVIADARRTGRWHDVSSGYVPQPGDLELEGRAGGDPRIPGQQGHIGVRIDGGRQGRRIDGNSADSMREVAGGGPLVVGWVQVSAASSRSAQVPGITPQVATSGPVPDHRAPQPPTMHRDDALALAIDRQAREALGGGRPPDAA